MSFWKLEKDGHKPEKPLVCRHCNGEMVKRWGKIFAHADYLHEAMRRKDAGEDIDEFLELIDKFPAMYSYAEDMEWKCPDCGYCDIFGVAISLEQYKSIREQHGGSQMYIPIQEWGDNAKIKQQLEDLGYFGG